MKDESKTVVELNYEPRQVRPSAARRWLCGSLLTISVVCLMLSLACMVLGLVRGPEPSSVVDYSGTIGDRLSGTLPCAGLSIMFYWLARGLRSRATVKH